MDSTDGAGKPKRELQRFGFSLYPESVSFAVKISCVPWFTQKFPNVTKLFICVFARNR